MSMNLGRADTGHHISDSAVGKCSGKRYGRFVPDEMIEGSCRTLLKLEKRSLKKPSKTVLE